MKKNVLFLLAMMVVGVCLADDITVRYDGAAVKVKQKVKDSVTVTVKGTDVNIDSRFTDRRLTLRLTGTSNDGRLVLKTAGKATVTLDHLTSNSAPHIR